MSSFESIPWCAALLQKPGVVRFIPQSRVPDGPSQDQLFKITLKTDNTIPEYLGFYQSPFSDPTQMTLAPTLSTNEGPRFLINTLSLLVDLRPGINGYNKIAHGGMIVALVDEAMGSLLSCNTEVMREMIAKGATIPASILNLTEVGLIFTATLNVKFMKPIPTPQVVMATATLTKAEGRKLVLDFDIKDSKGTEFAKGQGLWVSARKNKL